MAVNLAAFVTSFVIALMVLPVIIRYTLRNNLVDEPGGRKIHKKVTPSLGGIAIFIGFITSSLLWMDYASWGIVRFMLASIAIVFAIGVRDDLVPFRAMHKLYGQLAAIVILLFSPVAVESFHGLFGINELPMWISYVLSCFAIVVITNAFNLIDGLDGLAASVGFVALMAFGWWFFWVDDMVYALFCFALMGGIAAFLVFNWQPAEIFMGDTGAMVIGMMLSILALHFINMNGTLPDGHPAKVAGPISTAGCMIIVPLADTARIFILRILKGQSPFRPDKSHIHHAIMRLGRTHWQTSLILASINLGFIACAYFFRNVQDEYMLIFVVTAVVILSMIIDRMITKKAKFSPKVS
jgi:UDP-N-acetylmuramyl pentapeptide phosphotransferase/UDP-N-acetylglucosamine-1-phosphate transferase